MESDESEITDNIQEEEEDEDRFEPDQLPPYFAKRLHELLRSSCVQGHPTWVNLLINKGADVNDVDTNSNQTALKVAIVNGHVHLIDYLLPHANKDNIKNSLQMAIDRRDVLSKIIDKIKSHQGENVASEASDSSTQKTGSKNDQPNQVVEQLKKQISEMQADAEKTAKSLDNLKISNDKKENEYRSQIESLEKELQKERNLRLESDQKTAKLEQQQVILKEDIAKIQVQFETEKRAKENAKRILSVDTNSAENRDNLHYLDLDQQERTRRPSFSRTTSSSSLSAENSGNSNVEKKDSNKLENKDNNNNNNNGKITENNQPSVKKDVPQKTATNPTSNPTNIGGTWTPAKKSSDTTSSHNIHGKERAKDDSDIQKKKSRVKGLVQRWESLKEIGE